MRCGEVTSACSVFSGWDSSASRLDLQHLTSTNEHSFDGQLTTDDNPTSKDHKALIHTVVKAVCTTTASFCQAGKQSSIPTTTISIHFHGHKSPSFAQGCQQLLTNVHKRVVIMCVDGMVTWQT